MNEYLDEAMKALIGFGCWAGWELGRLTLRRIRHPDYRDVKCWVLYGDGDVIQTKARLFISGQVLVLNKYTCEFKLANADGTFPQEYYMNMKKWWITGSKPPIA